MSLLKRLLVPLALLIAVLALPAGAQAAYTLGVSDQQAGTFASPLFKPLKFQAARYITPYDVMSTPTKRAQLDAWLTAARAGKVKVLVSFEHSARKGRERRLPSATEYKREITKFRKAYPWVKEISTWNEVNRCVAKRGPVAGQPTCKQEKRLAQYYTAARKVFGSKTTILALDILDENNIGPALLTIKNFLKYAKPRPKLLGFHNYSDTNRFSTTRTSRIIKTWGGDVWLTETGGIVKLGRSFPFSPSRAAKAIGCMFTIAKQNKRVKRLYVYQFNGALATDRFDAGLITATGVKRPGYDVVKKRKPRACKK